MAFFPRIFKVFQDFRVDPGHHLVKLIAERVIWIRTRARNSLETLRDSSGSGRHFHRLFALFAKKGSYVLKDGS